MNFNLVNPKTENGDNFKVQFREPIEIKAGSKVYLNFASFDRLKTVTFTEEQHITFLTDKLFPKYIIDGTERVENKYYESIVIPSGSYSFAELEDYFNKLLNKVIKTNKFYYYEPVTSTTAKEEIHIGLYFDEDATTQIEEDDELVEVTKWKLVDFDFDAVNKLNFDFDENDGIISTGVNSASYNSYGLSKTHYFHWCIDNTINLKDNTQTEGVNYIHFKLNKPWSEQKGRVCLGLYSYEYSNFVWPDGYNYIHNNTLALVNNSPKCFLTIEVICDNGDGPKQIVLKVAQKENQTITNNILNGNIKNQINKLLTLKTINLYDIYSNDNMQPEFKLITYVKASEPSDLFNPKLYFKIIDQVNFNVYDSSDDDYFFDYEFFNINEPTTNFECNSAIPFNILVSANKEGEGFEFIYYREFDKSKDIGTDVRSFARGYDLLLTPLSKGVTFNNLDWDNINDNFEEQSELSKYLNYISSVRLFTNTTSAFLLSDGINWNDEFFWDEDILLDFLNDSYTISIDELPLLSYKNTESTGNGGYSQNILANVPKPFLDSVLARGASDADNKLVSGVYRPNFPSIVKMKNKDLKINKFTVNIRKLETDREASEIVNTIINFTIEEP